MTVQVFDQLRQFSGILAAVVDASYQTVFKCDPSASLFKIIPAGRCSSFPQGWPPCRPKAPSSAHCLHETDTRTAWAISSLMKTTGFFFLYTKHGAFGQHHFEKKRKRAPSVPVRPISGGLSATITRHDAYHAPTESVFIHTVKPAPGTMRKNRAVCSMHIKTALPSFLR